MGTFLRVRCYWEWSVFLEILFVKLSQDLSKNSILRRLLRLPIPINRMNILIELSWVGLGMK